MASTPATMTILEKIMRFTPASILLASMLALSASSGTGKKAPAAVAATPASTKMWMDRGAAALSSGDTAQARGAYETALLLSPGDPNIYFALGQIARAQKLPGKAIKYFADVQRLDPKNQLAVQGEGLAMMEKGATESARETLAKLKTLCKSSCAVAEPLASAIAAGPPKFASADANPAEKAAPIKPN
jgi:Flp pilus assembly protein TadD